MRLVDVDHRVELVGEPGVGVVRCACGLGSVYDADRALQPPAAQLARLEPEAVPVTLGDQRLPASGECAPHALALRRVAPVAGSGHRPAIGRVADQQRLGAMATPDELAEVELS